MDKDKGLKNKQGLIKNQQDNEANRLLDQTGLDQNDIEKLKKVYQRYDPRNSGYIRAHEIDDFIKDAGIGNVEYKNIKKFVEDELDKRKIRKGIDFSNACDIYRCLLQKIENDEQDDAYSEYIDAFVILGGNPDKSGFIQKKDIIKVIKEDFELTFDLEELMEKQGVNQDQLDFNQFCILFDPSNEESRSIISGISMRGGQKSTASFQVNYKDFEKWLEKMEHKTL